jgi:translocation and assembly module TamB
MNFKDRIFQIQSASMDFDNPSSINPRLSMVASTEINQTRIQFFATGRLEDYKIELSSNPALPQNEILSLLALGVTSDDMNRLRRSDQGVSQSGNAASLVLNSLDFNRDIKKKTGFQLQIDDAVNNVVGNSIFQSGPTTAAVNSSPKIVIRRKLTNRLDVSMGATVGVGTASQREFNAEYQVSKGASVMGVWNSIEGVDAANSLRSSFGLDLRLQKRFK